MSFIDRAKQKIRLVDYLSEVIGEPVKIGTTLRWSACPDCGVSEKKTRKLRLSRDGNIFRCAKCGAEGDVLMAIQLCEGLSSAVEAARWALYSNNCPTRVTNIEVTSVPKENEAMTVCLRRLFEVTDSVKSLSVIDYLTKKRALTANVILRAKKEGILRCLPSNPAEAIRFLKTECGEDLLRDSGLWRDGARAPGIAFRPLISFFQDQKGAEFRIARDPLEGEPKAVRYGQTTRPWVLAGDRDTWSITEGVIDMLSIPCLTPSYSGSIMGVPGCNSWVPEWFTHLTGKKVYICFDNDIDDPLNPGQRWAKIAFEQLAKIGAQPIIHLPKNGKDINSTLVERCS